MKKGFTLIELLAVIVVLAIVALIATPIILNVIEESKESANLRSVEGYANAVKNKYFNDSLGGGIPVIDATFLSNVETSGGEVKCNSVMYNVDHQTILYKCTVNDSEKKYCYSDSKHYDCNDQEFLNIYTGSGGEIALDGKSIKDVVLSNFPYLATNGNGCVTPTDNNYSYMGGCYLKGNPTNNSLWYSGFLWRIMGINADGTVRLITDENVTAIPWGEEDTAQNWDESYAKDWLNNYFYSRLKGNNIIKEETWCVEATTDYDSSRISCTTNLAKEKTKVGLITLDEYNLAGGRSSYLNIGQVQSTITICNSSKVWIVNNNGDTLSNSVSVANGIRAIINVNSDVTITGGNGTLGATWGSQVGPYILNEDKSVEVTGKLNEKSTSGEYVLFAGKKYRVVDKDSNGNTKLILDGYYEEDENIFEIEYGDDNIFSSSTGIGQKLNVDVLNWLTNNNDTEKRKLVSNYTWYQSEYDGGNYKISLNEENPTRSINATVGLIRVGEMLSSQSSSILTSGYINHYMSANIYWTMTPSTSSSYAWHVDDYGYADNDRFVFAKCGLRPVIVVKSDVIITGGNGTWSNPYQI